MVVVGKVVAEFEFKGNGNDIVDCIKKKATHYGQQICEKSNYWVDAYHVAAKACIQSEDYKGAADYIRRAKQIVRNKDSNASTMYALDITAFGIDAQHAEQSNPIPRYQQLYQELRKGKRTSESRNLQAILLNNIAAHEVCVHPANDVNKYLEAAYKLLEQEDTGRAYSMNAADVQYNIGVQCIKEGRLVAATKYLTSAKKLQEKQLDSTHPKLVYTLHALGRAYREQELTSLAENTLENARSLAGKVKHVGLILECSITLGQFYLRQSDYPQALTTLDKVMQFVSPAPAYPESQVGNSPSLCELWIVYYINKGGLQVRL